MLIGFRAPSGFRATSRDSVSGAFFALVVLSSIDAKCESIEIRS